MNTQRQTIRSILTALTLLCASARATTVLLVSDSFDSVSPNPDSGENVPLVGVSPNVYHTALAAAGGSPTWNGYSSKFNANGTINGSNPTGGGAVILALGSYINDHKGHPNGKFTLQADITITGGNSDYRAFSLGFSERDKKPGSNGKTFAEANNLALATIAARNNIDSSTEWYGYQNTSLGVASNNFAETRTYKITLDLREHNGTDHFGTISWHLDKDSEPLATWNPDKDHDFNSILLTVANRFNGSYDNLTLSQEKQTP
jgi:hypothetical protein